MVPKRYSYCTHHALYIRCLSSANIVHNDIPCMLCTPQHTDYQVCVVHIKVFWDIYGEERAKRKGSHGPKLPFFLCPWQS